MNHKIPKEVLNTTLMYCIGEYVRAEYHRNILIDKWFNRLTIGEIADKYYLSETSVKRVLYTLGDEIIAIATEISQKKDFC